MKKKDAYVEVGYIEEIDGKEELIALKYPIEILGYFNDRRVLDQILEGAFALHQVMGVRETNRRTDSVLKADGINCCGSNCQCNEEVH